MSSPAESASHLRTSRRSKRARLIRRRQRSSRSRASCISRSAISPSPARPRAPRSRLRGRLAVRLTGRARATPGKSAQDRARQRSQLGASDTESRSRISTSSTSSTTREESRHPHIHCCATAAKEYGYVLSGRLQVTIGFTTHELGPGDSIGFEGHHPAPVRERRGRARPRNLVGERARVSHDQSREAGFATDIFVGQVFPGNQAMEIGGALSSPRLQSRRRPARRRRLCSGKRSGALREAPGHDTSP